MLVKDITIQNDIVIINIPNTKNGSSRKFVLVEPLWIEVVEKYLAKRPTPDMPRLFISHRNGKPTKQNIGHNTISKVPQTIAKFLKLNNPETYTGHTFRRSSATILAEGGGDLLTLKRHGGWKSGTVAESYIEESIADKRRIAEIVQGTSGQSSNLSVTSSSASVVTSVHNNPMPSPSTNVYNHPMPSTSGYGNPTSLAASSRPASTTSETFTVENMSTNIPVVNIDYPLSGGSTSLNTGAAGINMTCHNCTINYYFGK